LPGLSVKRKRKEPNVVIESRKRSPGPAATECSICTARRQANTTEVYVISDGEDNYFFNVDKAKTIVSDGRLPIPFDEWTIRRIVAVNDYVPIHLAHVDRDKPGIMVERFGGLVLLDGIHRAVRSLQDGRTFHAYMLNYEESLACLIRQEIASHDAGSIVAKLRKVMSTAPAAKPIEAQIECSLQVLAQVRRMLTREEKQRFILKTAPRKPGK
jgi:hypothetical protein